MLDNKYVNACLSLLAAILLLAGVAVVVHISQPGEADAQTVQGVALVTVYSGADPYTSTQYSNPILAGYYGTFQLQAATTAATSTHVLSITPQFSNQAMACGSITVWVDGAVQELAPFDTYTSTSTSTVVQAGTTTQDITATVTLDASAGETETITSTVVTVGSAGTGDVVTSTTTVDTAGATTDVTLSTVSMLFRLEGAAPSAVMRGFPILGQCMRFKLESSGSDIVYTPTLYARLIND
jgi:hypothetical protein